jgi:hypothetical protein
VEVSPVHGWPHKDALGPVASQDSPKVRIPQAVAARPPEHRAATGRVKMRSRGDRRRRLPLFFSRCWCMETGPGPIGIEPKSPLAAQVNESPGCVALSGCRYEVPHAQESSRCLRREAAAYSSHERVHKPLGSAMERNDHLRTGYAAERRCDQRVARR